MTARLWVLSVLLLVPPAGAARAQSPAAEVSGTVRDSSGSVIPGVALSARDLDAGVTYSSQTDNEGRYAFLRLPQGRYQISAASSGFASSDASVVPVSGGQRLSLDLTLQVQPVQQSITVVGETAPLDLSSAHVGNFVNRIAMSALPVNGRSLEQLALLVPGVVPVRAKDVRSVNGFTQTISGGGARGATFLLDGLSVQHAMFGSDTPGGVSGLLLGMDAAEEFQVLTDAYPAYVPGNGGPVVSIVSRRGTRRFHGSAYEYHRRDAFDARNVFDTTEKPAFSRNQFGGWLGGPLFGNTDGGGSDNTFFAAYEGLRERLGRTLFATVPDARARQGLLPDGPVAVSPAVRSILDAYPLPNGESFGDGSAAFSYQNVQPTDDHHVNVRTDVALSPRDTLMVRYTRHVSAKVAPLELSLPGLASDLAARNHYLTVEENRVVSSRLISTLQVGVNRSGYESASLMPANIASIPPLIPGRPNFGRVNIRGLTSIGTDTADLYFRMMQIELAENVRLARGRHDWTFGANWKTYRSDGEYNFFFDGLLNYENLRDFLRNSPSRFTGAAPGSDARRRYRQHLFGFYVNDQFRWTPALTVNYGVRYDPFTVPTEADGKISNLRRLQDPAPTVGPPFRNPSAFNVGPRVGLAWNVGGSDRTVLRSGAGLYFDPVRENLFGYGARIQQPFVTVRVITQPPYPDPSGGARQGRPRQDPIEYDLATPYMIRYHLAVERALAPSLTFRAAYSGSRGVHLPRVGDLNVAEPVRVEPDGRLFFGTAAAVSRNPMFDRLRYTSMDANSFYNELQLGLSRRWVNGFQFNVNYSWAKSIDDASAYRRGFTNSLSDVTPYYYDRTLDRGLSNFHVGHNAVVSYTWDLPFRGSGGGLPAVLLRNWRTAGLVTIASGYPFTVNVSFDVANNLVREGHRPDLVPGASNNPVLGGPNRYFDVAAFSLQPRGYIGTLGRNTLIGPGYVSSDVSLLRTIQIAEGRRLELRLDVFNLLNRANFASPQNSGTGGVILFNDSTGVPLGNAARIFSTTGSSRQLQLGVRWLF